MAVPLPTIDELNRPHWEGAARGKMLVQRCQCCGHTRFPATKICEKCHASQNEWMECSGLGVIESYCTFHKAYWPELKETLPYTVIQVGLPEGLSFISNLSEASRRAPKIGAAVEAVFESVSEALTLIRFRERIENPAMEEPDNAV